MYEGGIDTVHFVRLRDVIRVCELNVTGPEVEDIRNLYCAVSEEEASRMWGGDWVLANPADAGRWRAATDAMIRTTERLRAEERDATRHLRRPWGKTRRVLSSVRHAHRNHVLRRDHDATMERLRTEMLAAYRRFRDQAADLTAHVKAERERYARERRQHEEQARRKRAAAMARPLDVPRWGYRVEEAGNGLRYRRFRVTLETLDADRGCRGDTDGGLRGGLTPHEVHAAFVEERERDPYLWLTFGLDTGRAMEEWRGSTAEAWQEITGHLVDEHPTRPEERGSSQRHYGPSSNYFSPGGFGSY
ncbi:hypothetical protein C3486_03695 [Streptomyces sp. Ru73]|uniref:hypothetical protein n=1 Tax=Streptomyces sp. Ru73 TaxID=2080748 RepID=UPI000CDD6017|nr:hypothetical protein [Streptomyces sp. Ru73]POX42687.1 hypothetical protein C3486_03695 [Streptomyces sp. Ru73]